MQNRAWITRLVVATMLTACGGAKVATAPPTPPAQPTAKAARVEKGTPRGGAAKGPVLAALEKELARTMTGYRSQTEPPYFVAYEVSDRRDIDIGAENGALVSSTDRHHRTLDVDVRVGSAQLDSTHAIRDRDRFDFFERYPEPVMVTVEDDERALRTRIWSRTEERYRSAVERLAKVRAQQKLKVAEEDRSNDFSVETATT